MEFRDAGGAVAEAVACGGAAGATCGEAASAAGAAGAPALDERAVEAMFPLIEAGRQAAAPLAYLDNAATTHKPRRVLRAMNGFYEHANANAGRGVYPLATTATTLYERARGAAERFVGAEGVDAQAVFTPGATSALNLVAFSWGFSHLRPGDEVVLTMAEHHSNLLPWQQVCLQTGAKLVYLLPDEDGGIPDSEIDAKIGLRTKVAAVTHVSNVLGSVLPVRRIADAAHAVGAIAVADCAQSVAHLPVDMGELGVDFLAFSGHKMFGPMGIGVLLGRREFLRVMDPMELGGGMIDHVFESRVDFAASPARFEAGTPNIASAVGLAEAMALLRELGLPAVQAHERRLVGRLLSGLAALPYVRVHGDPAAGEGRCGVVSFNVKGLDANDVARSLACDNVAVRAGAHCAEPLVRYLGERATCRASLALYNTEADVDRFLESVERARTSIVSMMAAGIR